MCLPNCVSCMYTAFFVCFLRNPFGALVLCSYYNTTTPTIADYWETMQVVYFFMFVLVYVFTSCECCHVVINGCSTPTKYAPYKKLFTPACNRHDVCYRCVSISHAVFSSHPFFNCNAICTYRYERLTGILIDNMRSRFTVGCAG